MVMIMLPDYITTEQVEASRETVRDKKIRPHWIRFDLNCSRKAMLPRFCISVHMMLKNQRLRGCISSLKSRAMNVEGNITRFTWVIRDEPRLKN